MQRISQTHFSRIGQSKSMWAKVLPELLPARQGQLHLDCRRETGGEGCSVAMLPSPTHASRSIAAVSHPVSPLL